ncbi:MAG: aminopeptidase P family N-terminal domain-containing protein [Eubacteriales bacterium]|nr:aminopeptidase P family N-terminal domain-containing protein [Eubacteriales bacterium]
MRKQITELREKMKELGIDVYIVSDKDEHLSEYTDAHFCALEEFSGFTGGDGTLAVSMNNAALWTDGRYFTQAEDELKCSGIELMRIGVAGTIPLLKWIMDELPQQGTLGFDGKCVSYFDGCTYLRAQSRGAKSITDKDVCGLCWKDRPAETVTKVWLQDEMYCGKPASVKLAELKAQMAAVGAKTHVLATLDDIAWLLNLRASDIECNPVFAAYMIVTAESAVLYSDARHFDKEILYYLSILGVELKDKDAVFEDITEVASPVLIDRKRSSYELCNSIPAGSHLIDRMNPEMTAKCIKNDIERKNIRIAQHRDSLAVTRYMHWFKTVVLPAAAALKPGENSGYTEWSTAEKLHELRAADKHFLDESFHTISAYGANAAMAHYMPSESRPVAIEPHGLYLVDSGGHYYEGTTDVTRTWSCGELNNEEKTAVTLSVIANLRLADARFLEGCSGIALDYAAREPFWRRGMNFNHGTGHGVGHVLNVHEGPTGIRYKAGTIEGAYPMLEGMYVSDEPGYYEAGKYGVRIENMLLVQKDLSNEYGNFCSFETCTFVPMDKECIDISLMNDEDIRLYNAYQQRVYDELSPDMDEAERAWLKEACEPLRRD